MSRSLLLSCVVLSCFGAGIASDAVECPAGPDGTCKGSEPLDNEVLLQAKARVEDDEASKMTEDVQVPYTLVWKGFECGGTATSKDLRMWEGTGDIQSALGPGATDDERIAACAKACLDKKTPLDGKTWATGGPGGSQFVAKGFAVWPSIGRCYCENADTADCNKQANNGVYDRYDLTASAAAPAAAAPAAAASSQASYTRVWQGAECAGYTGSREIRMYEGYHPGSDFYNAPPLGSDVVAECAKACLDKKEPVDGKSWTGFVAKGFIVRPPGKVLPGRCFCENLLAKDCRKRNDANYDRYDFQ